MTNSHPRSLALGLSLLLASCGGEGLILPPDGAPAHIEIMEGNGQSARAGSTLADSLVVRVTDTQDRPVAGANVVFEFTADGAAASPATVNTDGDGRAASRLAVGTRVGPVTGLVRVPVDPGVTPVQETITATVLPGDAIGIALVSGNDQTGQIGSVLSAPLIVGVTDASGNPISGVTVEWTVTGGGSVSNASATTDANGQASVTRTLGTAAGAQTAVATAAGLAGSPVTFTHTATAGTATGVVKVSGDNQSGSPSTELALPLVVQVLDGSGNPIPNRALTWTIGEGGGGVSEVNTTTDAQGNTTTRWTLGPGVGRNTVNAVVSGLAPATFTATATAGTPSAANSTVSASPGTISAGTGSSTITVTVRDATNNPVAGVSVTPASSGSGNTFTPASASTGANGVATFTFASPVAETKTITATAGGVALTDNATVIVQKVGSTVEITNDDPDPSTVGQNVVVEFTVSGSGGTPTGDVTITVGGGSETCSGTLSSGSGSCTVLLTVPGTGSGNRRVITATYAGDAQFSGDTDTENHRVDPVPQANNPPTAGFTSASCTAGQPCQFTDASSDTDGSIASRTWTFQDGTPSSSTDQNPSVTFASGGSKTVTVTVTDDDGANDSETKQIDVNTPPTAADDGTNGEYAALSGQPFTVPAPGVLANDSPPEAGDSYTASAGTTSANSGTVSMGPNGGFTYNSAPGFTGLDTFEYTLDDGRGGADTAIVTMLVN